MPEVLFQLGQALVALGQFDRAEPLFAEVQRKYQDHYLADWAAAQRFHFTAVGNPAPPRPRIPDSRTSRMTSGRDIDSAFFRPEPAS
jgi:hypothetical protein